MNIIRELTGAELDFVSGGADVKGYKFCSLGSSAGGGAGLYPKNVDCAVSQTDVINAFVGAFQKASGQRPA
jgi:hypothetical protein